ncbi:MAG: hypothetical protein GC165_07240 [Armatimonadetes bacterium]|nr:hypothetical protein [Armatimonadota bacterium]
MDTHYSPENAHFLSHELPYFRIRKLERGAQMTGLEEHIWQRCVNAREMDAEYVSVIRLQASDGTQAWFTISMNGYHLKSSIIDAAGPFWNLHDLILFCSSKVKMWHSWWEPRRCHEDVNDIGTEIERISGKPRADYKGLAA